jgi:hypothetical protein
MDHSNRVQFKQQLPKRWDEAIAQGVLASQSDSGLSVEKFCSLHGFGVPRFLYWKARLGKSKRHSEKSKIDCGGFSLLHSEVAEPSITRVRVEHSSSGLSLWFEGGRDLGFIIGDALSRVGLR